MKKILTKVGYMAFGSLLTLIGYHFGNVDNNSANAQENAPIVDEVRCRSLVIVGDDNTPRITLGTESRVSLGVDLNDSGTIVIREKDSGGIVAQLGVDSYGGYMALFNKVSETAAFKSGITDKGDGYAIAFDKAGGMINAVGPQEGYVEDSTRIIRRQGEAAMLPPPVDEPKQTKRRYRSDAPTEGASPSAPTDEPKQTKRQDRRLSLPAPTNESEMLNWLKVHDYTVAEEQGSYRISWQNLKPISPKPTAIVVNGDGTVVPQYGRQSVASGGSIVSVGDNNTSTVTNNGMTTTASTKYENGSWWIETIRSFVWDPSRDNINDVLSKAKKIKEIDEN